MAKGKSKLGNTRFTSVDELERQIGNNLSDKRAVDFQSAYSEIMAENRTMKKTFEQAIAEDGKVSEWTTSAEEKMTIKELRELPKKKTAGELGKEQGLKERLKLIDEYKKKKGKGSKNGRTETDVIVTKRG